MSGPQPQQANGKDVWERRWDALDATLGQFEKLLGPETDSEKPEKRKNTLRAMIKGLRKVGKKHFDYFHKGFYAENHRFEAHTDSGGKTLLSAEYAMRHVVDRIAYDVDAIQAALLQRRSNVQVPAARGIKVNLQLADLLAYKALSLAEGKGLPQRKRGAEQHASALTYFSDSIFTRVVPYATVAFVSVPLSSQREPRDLLAIPHEVGHYVYWNSDRGGDTLANRLRYHRTTGRGIDVADKNNWNVPRFRNWVEELFADTYGLLVAGAVMALDFQDLLLQFAKDDFDLANENRDHPTPILRPFIYTYVLRKVADKRNGEEGRRIRTVADMLDKRWWDELEERGYVRNIIPAGTLPRVGQGDISVPEGSDVIKEKWGEPLAHLLDDIFMELDLGEAKGWPREDVNLDAIYQEVVEAGNLEHLYTAFEDALKERPEVGEEVLPGQELDGPHYPDSTAQNTGKGDWLSRLNSGNWATRGPHSHM